MPVSQAPVPATLAARTLPAPAGRELLAWEAYVRDALAAMQTDRTYAVCPVPDAGPLGRDLREILHSARPWAEPIHCAKCGRELREAERTSYLNHLFAFRRFRCCGVPQHVLFSFRRPHEHPVGLVLEDEARLFVVPGETWRREGTDWVLWQAMLEFQTRRAREDAAPERVAPELAELRGPVEIIGRGTSNPGHLMFQDLVGALERARQTPDNEAPGPLVCTAEAAWIFPLAERLFPGRQVVRTGLRFAELLEEIERRELDVRIPAVRVFWPQRRDETPALAALTRGFADLGAGRAALFPDAAVVVMHIRFGPREWSPAVENALALMRLVRAECPQAKFVFHAAGDSRAPGLVQLTRAVQDRADAAMLVNPRLADLAANMLTARVCVGPIGTAFWWPCLADVPTVSLHPVGDPSTVVIYEWIARPANGELPLYLKMLSPGRWIGLEERRATPRKPFDPLHLPPEEVADAVLRLLAPSRAEALSPETLSPAHGEEACP